MLENFKVIVQKVLPTVYDNSLSYYELLNKVVHYLNTTIDQVNALGDAWDGVVEKVLPENVEKVLNDWYADGTLADLINFDLMNTKADQTDMDLVNAQLAENVITVNKISGVSIDKYDGNLALALQNEDIVVIPEGTYELHNTIPPELIANKTVMGKGNKSIIKLIGNISAFNIDKPASDTILKDFRISVEPTNTKDILSVTAENGITQKVKILNVSITTSNGANGLYTGLRLYSHTSGIYRCEFDIRAEFCKNGVILETTNIGWVTHSDFKFYISQFSNIAFGIIKNGGTISANIIREPFVIDVNMSNSPNPSGDRFAYVIDGQNTIIAPQLFNDSISGTLYAFDFKEGSRSQIIGGYVEGLIKNEKYVVNNQFTCNVVKRRFSGTTKPYNNMNYINNPVNILHFGSFENGFKHFTTTGCSAEVIDGGAEYYNRKILKLTKTSATGLIAWYLPQKEQLIGKLVNFTLAMKTDVKAYCLINEGSAGVLKFEPDSTGILEIVSGNKKIVGGSSLALAIYFDATAPIGSIIYIDWFNLNYGSQTPVEPQAIKAFYKSASKGYVNMNGTNTSVTVTHGLDITPKIEDIRVNLASTLGNAAYYYISDVTATTFKINTDVPPMTANPNFIWDIRVS